jgi:hydroxypyruvate isomerase
VNSPNVKLLFDIYHQQITEGNLLHNILNNIDLIGHFHVADTSGRHEAGTGEINYKNIFKAIGETNYNGFIGLEYSPTVLTARTIEDLYELAFHHNK